MWPPLRNSTGVVFERDRGGHRGATGGATAKLQILHHLSKYAQNPRNKHPGGGHRIEGGGATDRGHRSMVLCFLMFGRLTNIFQRLGSFSQHGVYCPRSVTLAAAASRTNIGYATMAGKNKSTVASFGTCRSKKMISGALSCGPKNESSFWTRIRPRRNAAQSLGRGLNFGAALPFVG